ncbi:MAG: hypothetical protein WBF21_07950 [Steroidobacteraceae bacterium]
MGTPLPARRLEELRKALKDTDRGIKEDQGHSMDDDLDEWLCVLSIAQRCLHSFEQVSRESFGHKAYLAQFDSCANKAVTIGA